MRWLVTLGARQSQGPISWKNRKCGKSDKGQLEAREWHSDSVRTRIEYVARSRISPCRRLHGAWFMKTLALLDSSAPGSNFSSETEWFSQIYASLVANPEEWIAEIRADGTLQDERARRLLVWVENAATRIVRDESGRVLELASFAVSLIMASGLDRRDVWIVCALLRRAAELANLDFYRHTSAGMNSSDEWGVEALEILQSVSSGSPTTHREVGVGRKFSFEPIPPDFDVDELERWLEGE